MKILNKINIKKKNLNIYSETVLFLMRVDNGSKTLNINSVLYFVMRMNNGLKNIQNTKMRILVVVIAVLVFGLTAKPAMAALPVPSIFMEVEGETQGSIEGSCNLQGREGTILVWGFEHKIHVPVDPYSGQLAGQKTHGPLTIVKEFDRSSPLLYRALCNGERLPVVEIKFYRIDQTGSDVHYFTITLEDAIIVEMKPYFPIAFLPENDPYRHMEEVSFSSYRRIMWTHEIAGTSTEDIPVR